MVAFGDIADFRNGLNYNRQNFGRGLKVVSVADFGDRRVPDYSSLGEINPDGVATEEDLLTDGDLLFVRSNGNRALVGRVLFLEAPPAEVGFSGFCIRARVHRAIANPKYYSYFFRSKAARDALSSGGTGASIQSISQGALKSVFVPLPSIKSQLQTVAVLQPYDDLIENNQRRIKLLEEAARRLYREWFAALRFPGHERVKVVDGVPQGWTLATLGDALQLQRGFDLPSGARKEGAVPIIASTGVTGFHDEARVSGPGVVTGRSGTLGAVHFVHEDFWPLNTSLWVKEFRLVTPLVAYFMLLELGLSQFNSGASVPTLDRKAVHPMPTVIPAMPIQSMFEAIAGPMFSQIRLLNHAASKAKQARDALLPRLMSGALAV